MRPHRLLALAALALMLPAAGCVAVAAAGAGAGTYAYVTGDLEQTLDAPIQEVHAAALAAIDDLGYTLVEERSDALESRIESEQADGTSVKIRLNALSDSQTRTRIRVGLFGNEDQSARILREITSRL